MCLSDGLGGLLQSLGMRLARSSTSSSTDTRLRLVEFGEWTYSGVDNPGAEATGDVAERGVLDELSWGVTLSCNSGIAF